MSPDPSLSPAFDQADADLMALEVALREGQADDLSSILDRALRIVKALLRAFAGARGAETDPVAASALASDDVLEVFKGFVKGDPSLNAVRDNIRELVYYRNCLDLDRRDALPTQPEAMAVRTARPIYFYLRTRALQAHLLDAD